MDKLNNETAIYINGKSQVVEMLRAMSPEEKVRLIKNLKLRNPALASELEEKSFSFKDLFRLPDSHLKYLITMNQAAIMGIAIRNVPIQSQKKLLSLADRAYAEEAFEWMTRELKDEKRDITRAQEKILNSAAQILKKN